MTTTLTYEEKKVIADKYISDKLGGLTWDDLADINSLHDYESEEDIIEACNERINEEGLEGFRFD